MARAGEKKNRLAKISDFGNVDIEWDFHSQISPETSYIDGVTEARRQHFAQFFTPAPIAKMMAEWVASIHPKNILEPSVGTGILVRAISELISDSKITCIDIDQAPMSLAKKSAPRQLACEFLHADFLLHPTNEEFDGILSNPPYLRHHDISYSTDIHAEIGKRNHITISKACNLYVLFIFEICRLLAKGGRAAILVPADWLNSNAALCLRDYLMESRSLKELLYFDESDNHFDGALTTSVVILLENDEKKNPTLTVRHFSSGLNVVSDKVIGWDSLKKIKKWNNFLVGEVFEKNDSVISLSTLAKTKRGLATGANEFFHLTDAEVSSSHISHENLVDCIGNAKDVSGLIFSEADLSRLAQLGSRTKLVNFSGELSDAEKQYIKRGEDQGFHERFLLARRRPWYKNEKRDPAPIWAASFGRDRVRFIWNKSQALNLTTYHCIYPKNLTVTQLGALVCLLNSGPIQKRFAEHLRVLGGGLLKFQPNDLLSIEIPDVQTLSEDQLSTLNAFLVAIDIELRLNKSPHNPKVGPISDLDAYVEMLLNSSILENERITEMTNEQLEMF
ncbi:N-6 DNA methylase [Janthinobacterium sp. 75]|uniref:Eco57I restriction-modification methylase domain-containing protein n=1 Tax=Janthinobacterium sp. 75 TaxID=2135628 RepID=UPI001062871C|nr:N-6 DNA methylase [Janthinobacterium sp. 75]TDY35338.1 N-6 DNA methylase [Janthinobacterium sp. 75]